MIIRGRVPITTMCVLLAARIGTTEQLRSGSPAKTDSGSFKEDPRGSRGLFNPNPDGVLEKASPFIVVAQPYDMWQGPDEHISLGSHYIHAHEAERENSPSVASMTVSSRGKEKTWHVSSETPNQNTPFIGNFSVKEQALNSEKTTKSALNSETSGSNFRAADHLMKTDNSGGFPLDNYQPMIGAGSLYIPVKTSYNPDKSHSFMHTDDTEHDVYQAEASTSEIMKYQEISAGGFLYHSEPEESYQEGTKKKSNVIWMNLLPSSKQQEVSSDPPSPEIDSLDIYDANYDQFNQYNEEAYFQYTDQPDWEPMNYYWQTGGAREPANNLERYQPRQINSKIIANGKYFMEELLTTPKEMYYDDRDIEYSTFSTSNPEEISRTSSSSPQTITKRTGVTYPIFETDYKSMSTASTLVNVQSKNKPVTDGDFAGHSEGTTTEKVVVVNIGTSNDNEPQEGNLNDNTRIFFTQSQDPSIAGNSVGLDREEVVKVTTPSIVTYHTDPFDDLEDKFFTQLFFQPTGETTVTEPAISEEDVALTWQDATDSLEDKIFSQLVFGPTPEPLTQELTNEWTFSKNENPEWNRDLEMSTPLPTLTYSSVETTSERDEKAEATTYHDVQISNEEIKRLETSVDRCKLYGNCFARTTPSAILMTGGSQRFIPTKFDERQARQKYSSVIRNKEKLEHQKIRKTDADRQLNYVIPSDRPPIRKSTTLRTLSDEEFRDARENGYVEGDERRSDGSQEQTKKSRSATRSIPPPDVLGLRTSSFGRDQLGSESTRRDVPPRDVYSKKRFTRYDLEASTSDFVGSLANDESKTQPDRYSSQSSKITSQQLKELYKNIAQKQSDRDLDYKQIDYSPGDVVIETGFKPIKLDLDGVESALTTPAVYISRPPVRPARPSTSPLFLSTPLPMRHPLRRQPPIRRPIGGGRPHPSIRPPPSTFVSANIPAVNLAAPVSGPKAPGVVMGHLVVPPRYPQTYPVFREAMRPHEQGVFRNARPSPQIVDINTSASYRVTGSAAKPLPASNGANDGSKGQKLMGSPQHNGERLKIPPPRRPHLRPGGARSSIPRRPPPHTPFAGHPFVRGHHIPRADTTSKQNVEQGNTFIKYFADKKEKDTDVSGSLLPASNDNGQYGNNLAQNNGLTKYHGSGQVSQGASNSNQAPRMTTKEQDIFKAWNDYKNQLEPDVLRNPNSLRNAWELFKRQYARTWSERSAGNGGPERSAVKKPQVSRTGSAADVVAMKSGQSLMRFGELKPDIRDSSAHLPVSMSGAAVAQAPEPESSEGAFAKQPGVILQPTEPENDQIWRPVQQAVHWSDRQAQESFNQWLNQPNDAHDNDHGDDPSDVPDYHVASQTSDNHHPVDGNLSKTSRTVDGPLFSRHGASAQSQPR